MSRRKRMMDNLDQDIRDFIERETQDSIDRGMSPKEARYAALRKLGNVTRIKEETWEVWSFDWLDQLWQDVRYAVRMIRKNRGFTATALLSLAIGIGANTAIFSLIDALLLRMLPVRDPQQLVQVLCIEDGRRIDSLSYPAVRGLQERADRFSGISAFSGGSFNAGPPGAIEKTPGAWVTGNFYQTLGVSPALGRTLTPQDDVPGAMPVAVITYRYWEGKYNRDTGVLGKELLVEGTPVTIAGVSAKGFSGANVGEAADITLPLALAPTVFPERRMLEVNSQWLRVLARPKPGISAVQAKAQLVAIWPQMMRDIVGPIRIPERRAVLLRSTLDLERGGMGWSYLRNTFARPLLLLMTIVVLLLLVACANVANLLLSRGTARSREIAVRSAMGGGRWRLLRQLLTEGVLLSLLGAALGVLLAYAGDRMLLDLLATGATGPVALDVYPDARVLSFTTVVALITGVLSALTPAMRMTAWRPGPALKSGTSGQSGGHQWVASSLVVGQVSLSLVLLMAAGLFVRTLENLRNLDEGFQNDGVLLVNLDARHAGYRDTRLAALYGELLERLSGLPGVTSASLSANTPLSGGIWSESILLEGQAPRSGGGLSAHFNTVAPGYFATMRTPVVLGRDFARSDDADAPPVAIVNEAFVRSYLRGRNPLGVRVSVQDNPDAQDMEVVGVVGDTVSFDLRAPAPPFVYVPYFQQVKSAGFATIELRARGSLGSVADAVRWSIHDRLSNTAVTILPFGEQIERALEPERLVAALASLFAAIALGLAAVGLYGLVAYTVTRQTHEIGVRMALGANRLGVLWMVLRAALALVGAGLLIGLPISFAASTLVSKMLFGLRPTDLSNVTLVSGLLLLVAALAAYLPARRATKVDPMEALRYE
jgi:putative ABC transport system permease protein